ncbi:MAG: glycerate dehydrogenase, partial [Billgrantia desiderata]
MKAVILDAASLGPNIDLSAIRDQVETLEVHEASTTEQSRQRLAGAQVAIVNKVVLDAATLEALP